MNHFIGAFKKFSDVSGRAYRTEFWMFVLIYLIISIAFTVIDIVLGTGFIGLVFALVMIVPSITITTRRLHDTGRTGWWQLIGIIPIIGFIVMLVFLIQDSQDENSYGANPKPVS